MGLFLHHLLERIDQLRESNVLAEAAGQGLHNIAVTIALPVSLQQSIRNALQKTSQSRIAFANQHEPKQTHSGIGSKWRVGKLYVQQCQTAQIQQGKQRQDHQSCQALTDDHGHIHQLIAHGCQGQ